MSIQRATDPKVLHDYEDIHEPIAVVTDFGGNKKPKILSFTWQGREYKVKETNLVVRANKGREKVWMFHVSNERAAFKLRLDSDTLDWWLEEYTWEEAN